ncbi:MAG: molybdenum cofactor biosynthesis protein MoaE [Acidobacteriaceae bacterium]|nr:molybdenum cofactor biosynthesis protein MoaE [Acidobacteriaceae bacterium]
MRVRVLFFGVLKDIVGASEESLEIAANSTVGSLFERYAERFETLRDKRPSILFARNREFTAADALLRDEDEIAFLPPVSGGSERVIEDEKGHFFSLTRDVIDASRLARRLQMPEDGAVITFEGVVRNNTRGRATLYLEYECYEEMALEQMARIGREIASEVAIDRLGAIHRLGRLRIGEASVAIVVAAAHRGPAFKAALETINRLKREVPIWKKEFFADGAVWVDGEWDARLAASSLKHEG